MAKSPTLPPVPAYEDLYHNHPTHNPSAATGPTTDTPPSSSVAGDNNDEEALHLLRDDPNGPYERGRQQQHVHCETCDKQQTERMKMRYEYLNNRMVAWTCMVLFVCAMLFGMVVWGVK
ncbi:hypothetical protein ACLMJK_005802 [Lecanora helva]